MKQFLGSESQVPYSQARAVILPIPYEATTTYRKGCEEGPDAILEASDQLEAYDEELDWEPCHTVGVYTWDAVADTRQTPDLSAEKMLAATTETVRRLIEDKKFVVALGGEHAITTGVAQAYRDALNEPFTVVQIDAHGDLRSTFEGSEHNHACVMRRVRELGLPTLPVGIRAICREEAELIKAEQIPVLWAREIDGDPQWVEKALSLISTPKVFLTIDLDGLDPGFLPGVGTPEPGGLGWHETLRFLRRLCEEFEVVGADVMELAPLGESVVSEFTAAKLIYKLIGYRFYPGAGL